MQTKRTRAPKGQGERLREEILAAAEQLLIETGDEARVSIRAVAERVGCTPPAIYLHFEDKTDLILAVCEMEFEALHRAVEEASEGVEDPVASVRAGCMAYVRFGLERPEQYRIIFMSRPGEAATRLSPERVMSSSAFSLLMDGVQACIDAGAFARADVFTLACGIWSALHGIVSLLIAKPFFPWPDRDAMVAHCLDAHLEGLRVRG